MTSDTVRYRRLDGEFARLMLRGQDRVRFLSGMVTCDVKGLGPQAGTYGALLTVKGKVVSDLLVANRSGDDLLLLVRSFVAKHVMDSLDRYIIVDDAVLTDESEALAHLGVYGVRALAVLTGDPAASLEPYQLRALDGAWLWACRELGPESVHVIGPAAAVAAIEQRLSAAGAQELSSSDAEVLRVESGRPRMGVDFDEERLPQEAALDDALCFTKGCFLGQEDVGKPGKLSLYDLSNDIGEKNDLAEKHPDIVAKLTGIMQKAWTEPRSQESDGTYTGSEEDH